MTTAFCKALVEARDPDRYLVSAALSEAAQARLWPLYALNLELACVPWASEQPLVSEMRLQWWVDALAETAHGKPPKGHPVLEPLSHVIREAALPLDLLTGMAEARRWDVWTEPFEDEAAFTDYIDQTSSALMCLAAKALGAGAGAEGAVRAFGWGAGVAAWLRAVPELSSRNRHPLLDPGEAGIRALAQRGLEKLSEGRRGRGKITGKAAPAMLTGGQSGVILRQALAEPARVFTGSLAMSEFHRRGALVLRGLTGRW